MAGKVARYWFGLVSTQGACDQPAPMLIQNWPLPLAGVLVPGSRRNATLSPPAGSIEVGGVSSRVRRMGRRASSMALRTLIRP